MPNVAGLDPSPAIADMMPRKRASPAARFVKEVATMNRKLSLKQVAGFSILAVALHGAAIAAEARLTRLVCTVRAGSGDEHQVDIRNSASQVLAKNTVINLSLIHI